MLKKWTALLLAVAMLLCLTACSGEKVVDKQPEDPGREDKSTLVVAISENPGSFNPNWKTDDHGNGIYMNIFNKLVVVTGEFEIRPDLAKDWEISDDGLTYTFYLEEDVKWHDGVPFTSADVKWSIDAIKEFKGRMANDYKAIESVECLDDYTVVLHLSRPDAPLISFLSWYACFMMPKHIYEGTDWTENPANQNPIGTGPYKFVSWKQGESVELAANPDYFKGAPAVERVVYTIIPDANTALQSFKNGEVDILSVSPPPSEIAGLQADPNVTVILKEYPSRWYMGMNFANEWLKDLRVRQALAYAIDRKEILERAFENIGAEAYGFYTPIIAWAYNDKDLAPKQDIEKAKQLLDDAGMVAGADGVRVTFDFVHFPDVKVADTAAILKEQLKAVGIDINIISLEMASWVPRVPERGEFDLTMANGYHGPDPHNLYGRVASDGGQGLSGPYANYELDAVLFEASVVSNQDERGKLYKEGQRIMSEDLPFLPLIDIVSTIVYAGDIEGHPQSPEGGAAGLAVGNFSLIRFR